VFLSLGITKSESLPQTTCHWNYPEPTQEQFSTQLHIFITVILLLLLSLLFTSAKNNSWCRVLEETENEHVGYNWQQSVRGKHSTTLIILKVTPCFDTNICNYGRCKTGTFHYWIIAHLTCPLLLYQHNIKLQNTSISSDTEFREKLPAVMSHRWVV
jgi:hypothetical protein